MAITPTQAKQQATPDQDRLKALEQRIDEAIVQELEVRGTSSSITLDSNFFGSGVTRQTLESKYRSAGWNVKYTSDQRDGDFYTLTQRMQNPTIIGAGRAYDC